MKDLKENICQTLLELHTVIGQLSQEQYAQALPIFSGASIGMHARHIVEFYQTLLTQSTKNQCINYEMRQRNLSLQTDLVYFIKTVDSLIGSLDALDIHHFNTPLSIVSEEADMPIPSSLARELQYNLEHTIHHAAIIKIGILSLNADLMIPPSFGVAPSTLRYRKQIFA
jgi:hypothetical protein